MITEARFSEVLRQRLRDAGAALVRPRPQEDIAFRLGDVHYVVEFKAARDARLPALRGALAEATLEAQGRSRTGERWLPIVAAPAITDAMAEGLRAFMERVAPTQPWGIADARGRLDLFIDKAHVQLPPLEGEGVLPSHQGSPGASIFSDTHQWLLKVLLAQDLPGDLLRAPRMGPGAGTRELSRLARVSLGATSRFLSLLEVEGYVERSRKRIALVRRRELFEAWLAAARPRSTRLGLSWLIAPSDPGNVLPGLIEQMKKHSVDAAVGLHSACDALGFGFVRGTKPFLWVARLDGALVALKQAGLTPSADGQASDLFVARPCAPRSCFAGAVERGQLWVTDIIQCWLDVRWHPARGQEQAEFLWEQVIEPNLLKEGR